MKTSVLALCIASLFVASSAMAQEGLPPGQEPAPTGPATKAPAAAPQEGGDADNVKPRSFGIFVNPLSLAFGTIGAEFDYSPLRMLAVGVEGSYAKRDSASAVGGGAALQLFLTGDRSFNGMYLRGFGDVYSASASISVGSENVDGSATAYTAGGTLGYQWAWDPGISFRLGAGVQYMKLEVEAHNSSGQRASVGFKGMLPALDATLGFVF